ncbi:hypothetical protein CY35_08G134400 [Sphagnum magellanicum]|nr:hypothetical protein CY35_08G134400 [Sphagnum magellanicum]
MGGKEKEVKVLAMKGAEESLSDQISNKKKMKKKKREVEEKRFEQEEVSNDSSKKKKKERREESTQEADTEVEEPVKKKKKKQIKEKKEREVDDNRSLKKNLNTGAEETAVVRGTAEAQLCVTVSGNGSADPKFAPLESFDLEGVPTSVLECCKTFAKPSPIQSHAWPFLLAGRDLVGIAATGSGKTLAFGIPAMTHVLKKKKEKKATTPLCLVLSPTRELAQQIADVLEEAGSGCGVKTACIYGGTSKGPQRSALRAGATIIIATPGRLQDLMEEGVCSLDQVSYLVLDEADRMLDLGFEPAIRAIISKTSKIRQTVMFSATWPLAVDQLAREFMNDPSPVKVMVGSQDLAANHDVTQIVEVLEDRARDARLDSLLQKYHKSRTNRVLVFVLYKKEADRVENSLQRRGWKVSAVHGDKTQADRTKAVNSFKDGTRPLLIATDVAARGLDIPDVEYVINYSFPLTTEDYVHRIGRTGRAGRKGIAHTFFTQTDRARSGELVNVLREAGQTVPEELLKFGTHVKKKESKLYGAHFKEIGVDSAKATKITFGDSDDE